MSFAIKNKDLVFIDTETTGSLFGYHEIIDIAAIRCSADGHEIKIRWQKCIRPNHPERITEVARSVNGFTEEAWAYHNFNNADIWIEFRNRFSGCIPICHNPAFDRAFVTLSYSSVGVGTIGIDHHWIGTESIAWPLYKQGILGEKFSLSDLCDELDIEPESKPHNALGGAELCFRLYGKLMELYLDNR